MIYKSVCKINNLIIPILQAALAINTGVMIDFGLSDVGMGVFLVFVNLTVPDMEFYHLFFCPI